MDQAQIQRIRSFNRTITRRVGALSDSFLGRGRPLSECRLLYEIGTHGADIRTLRNSLALDSGFLSRLLRSLEKQGLVKSAQAKEDGRVRRALLTRKGQKELAELDRRSDEFAVSVLAPLNDGQRARLVKAMAEAEQLMQASAVEVAPERITNSDSQHCLRQYFAELQERFESGFDTTRSPTPVAEFMPPNGLFLVARLDGRPVACGGIKFTKRGAAEIKRMWVHSSVRGMGLGRRMLRELEEQARTHGFNVVQLETNEALKEAQALYRASGYREVAPFNDEPYANHWFEKKGLLGDVGAGTRRRTQGVKRER
jgi:DNA-binding MarR family transcriptional regulator/GNAT superfamily N-acetyltransferase